MPDPMGKHVGPQNNNPQEPTVQKGKIPKSLKPQGQWNPLAQVILSKADQYYLRGKHDVKEFPKQREEILCAKDAQTAPIAVASQAPIAPLA